ncbi:MAG: outer membrane beta-barrel protein [Xanthobacteraceae bacterium]
MRWVICTLFVLAFVPRASADDFDVLRGSQPVGPATFTRWSGIYAGGQFSYGQAAANFANATAPLVGFSLRNTQVEQQATPSQWQVLGRDTGNAFGGGGFLGYNTQWQDLILGVEGNYTHTSFSATSTSSPISRLVSVGNVSTVTISQGNGHLDLTDYAELRGRAGYVVGNLLPYGFVGFVVGRGDYSVSATTDATCTNPNPPPSAGECQGFPITSSASNSNAFLYGGSVGFGLDWAITPNLFLRGEFEYIVFTPLASINVSVINARVGAGVKF